MLMGNPFRAMGVLMGLAAAAASRPTAADKAEMSWTRGMRESSISKEERAVRRKKGKVARASRKRNR